MRGKWLFNVLMILTLTAGTLTWEAIPATAADPMGTAANNQMTGGTAPADSGPMPKMRSITNAQREEAARRAAESRRLTEARITASGGKITTQAIGPGSVPDYFGTTPNFANSPQAVLNVTVSISGGGGTGAEAKATVGAVTGLVLGPGGRGYTSPPVVTISGGGGYGATAVAAVSRGSVVSLNLTGGGMLYDSEPTVNFTGGGGTGAGATATVAPGVITGIIVTRGGEGYTSAPTIEITSDGNPNGGATAGVPTILDGTITTIPVANGGTGYGLMKDSGGKTIGIRKFVSPLPVIPTATPDTITYPGYDYYEIALRQYTQTIHPDLPETTLRGYVQLNNGTSGDANTVAPAPIQYLGPIIVAQSGKPVRILFHNELPTGNDGDLFLPTDTTVMGAGAGPTGEVTGIRLTSGGTGYTFNPTVTVSGGGGTGATAAASVFNGAVNDIWITNPGSGYTAVPTVTIGGDGTGAAATAVFIGTTEAYYTQNRATVHLHGGITPWISDGTPHQWITPATETTPYPEGVSVVNVPDMPDPGPGSMTLFYTNEQSARLMFYHEHAYGITRLGVYSGIAAGYLVQDQYEDDMKNGTNDTGINPDQLKVIPANTEEVNLIVQDRTFVPDTPQLARQDPTWDTVKWGGKGSLWFPHVYMPNQNPADPLGINAMGRWDYGPWFWPPFTNILQGPVDNPYYVAGTSEGQFIPGVPSLSQVPESYCDTPVVNGLAYPYLQVQPKAYRFRILNGSNERSYNLQIYFASSNGTMWDPDTGAALDPGAGEINMVPAVPNSGLPAKWPADGRAGGVPDPSAIGPKFIQIGTEGGFLPAPAVLPNQPVDYDYNRRSATLGNVTSKTLLLAPAERADVIVDFSQVPIGSKLIIYNDAPSPVPLFDTRNDYFTGDPDQTSIGGAPTTLPGYGPNTRTIMQIQVIDGTPASPFNLTNLQNVLPAAYAASQPLPLVPESVYGAPFHTTYTNTYSQIQDTTLKFTPAGQAAPITMDMQPKSIIEDFDMTYGRMNAMIGVEIPKTTATTQTSIPYFYVDPPTETILNSSQATPIGALGDGTQIWKITHNGVDTHAMHVHMFNLQLINRVGWDGSLRPPDPNEVGWKETVRMNPLEDCIVAVRPITPNLPFQSPDSYRPLDVTMPLGTTGQFHNVDPNNNPVTVTNQVTDFGWEYVWHCHLLGHEEYDMMRPMVILVSPVGPSNLSLDTSLLFTPSPRITLRWSIVNPTSRPPATGYTIQRATDSLFTKNVVEMTTAAPATSFIDANVTQGGGPYYYKVQAEDTAGYSTWSNVVHSPPPPIPSVPVLIWPTVGQTVASLTPTLQWNASTYPRTYNVQVSTSSSFSALIVNRTGIAGLSLAATVPNWNTTYYWRVSATNTIGTSAWSQTRYFRTQNGPGPAAPSGLTATPISNSTIALSWTNNAVGISGMKIERQNLGALWVQIAIVGPTVTTYNSTGLTGNLTYNYRVRAYSGTLNSDYSNTATATTWPPLPGMISLLGPASNSLQSTTPTLNWSPATSAAGYRVQIATDRLFASLVVDQAGILTTSFTVPGGSLTAGTPRYYWRVGAVNITGTRWSTYRYFRT